MATTALPPSLQTTQQQQQQQQEPVQLSSPPADSNINYSKFGSSHISSLPAYTDKSPKRASLHRYSWSSASSSNSTPSPTSPKNGTVPTRKFRLPVRVSTDLTSFKSSDSSPQSRRRSLSLASDSKRRSSLIPALKKVDESNKKELIDKPAPKSPEKSPSKEQPSPPPAYKDTTTTSSTPVSDPKDTKPPPPTYQDSKPRATTPPKPVTQPPQPVQKPVAPSPVKSNTTAAPRSIPTTVPTKMSSAASSPDAQKATIANPMASASRGLDFSVGNGNTNLTHQSEHGGALPLPHLSGKGNGPVGNLLRGPVDDEGNLKAAALTVGIKLDLETEVHLSARIRGDIIVGLY